jgi:hypothetical protein
MEEYSYTSTQTLGHTGPVTGIILVFHLVFRTEPCVSGEAVRFVMLLISERSEPQIKFCTYINTL